MSENVTKTKEQDGRKPGEDYRDADGILVCGNAESHASGCSRRAASSRSRTLSRPCAAAKGRKRIGSARKPSGRRKGAGRNG